ncbi:MAG: hypothetical protein RLZZ324_91 [Candidatus Parcubacteria bacterium]|jgi:hypothetical protein
MKRTNETYEVEIASPLLRPGITIRTRVSKKYLSATVKELLDIVREINVAEDKCPTP